MKRALAILFVALLILPGLGCRGGSQEAKDALEPVPLTVWRVFDGQDAFDDIIASYRAIHPNVRVEYRKLRFEEYQDELLRAFAEDRGPDIFSVHDTWMKGYQSLIEPMPETVRITFQEMKGTFKKEQVITVRNERTMSLRDLNDQFVEIVPKYVVYPTTTETGATQNSIFGLPLSVDTLALFYNRDLLDAAGIPQPPRTWEDFQADVVKLTKYDARGDIAQSGAAIGTGANVERAGDIVSLLMMQSGAKMTDARGQAVFSQAVSGANGRTTPSQEALRFYTDFANPTKEVYTWDKTLGNSFDAFASGQTAFFLGYSYHVPLLQARSRKLNYSIAPAPQISEDPQSSVNYANFWIETVSKKSENTDWAWDFVQYMADEKNVSSFLKKAGKPTALRGLVLDQGDDIDLAVFANQVLSADAWYNGANATAAEKALSKMIDSVVSGTRTIEEALQIGEQEVNETL